MEEKYVTDSLGWIDDFSAPAGSVGHPFVRRMAVHSHLVNKVLPAIHELKSHGYDYETVATMALSLIDQAYERATWKWETK